jgi:hypothetical protein
MPVTLSPYAIDESAAKTAAKSAASFDLGLTLRVREFLVGERTEAVLPMSRKSIRMTHAEKCLADGTYLYKLDALAVKDHIDEVKKIRPELYARIEDINGHEAYASYEHHLYLHVRSNGVDWLTNDEARALIVSLSEKL